MLRGCEARALQQHDGERIGSMAGDCVGGGVACLHCGIEERVDVFERGHGFFAQRNFAMRLASSFVSLRRDFLPPLAAALRSHSGYSVFIEHHANQVCGDLRDNGVSNGTDSVQPAG